MALTNYVNWYVRAGGNAANGGGWDSTISGAGTNYCDQDSHQLSLSDLATPGMGSTTLTSSTGGFTSAMIGNCIRISSGTNFTAGYYFVVGYSNSNTVTLDRTPTGVLAGSSGVGRLGGAFATIGSLANGGNATQPSITSPLAAGHTVNIRGAGSDNPGVADYTQTGYYTYASGNTTSGRISFKGYNGRPLISCNGLCFYNTAVIFVSGLNFKLTAANSPTAGIINGTSSSITCHNCQFDQNGNDIYGIVNGSAIKCTFLNSGSTSSGSYYAVSMGSYGNLVSGCYIEKWRGGGVLLNQMGTVHGNIINGTIGIGVSVTTTGGVTYGHNITSNTIYNNSSDGIKVSATTGLCACHILSNIIYKNAGYGINLTPTPTATNDLIFLVPPDYNCVSTNTSGNYNNLSAGTNDFTLDPQIDNFTTSFTPGFSCWGKGFPQTFINQSAGSYPNVGAVQARPKNAHWDTFATRSRRIF